MRTLVREQAVRTRRHLGDGWHVNHVVLLALTMLYLAWHVAGFVLAIFF